MCDRYGGTFGNLQYTRPSSCGHDAGKVAAPLLCGMTARSVQPRKPLLRLRCTPEPRHAGHACPADEGSDYEMSEEEADEDEELEGLVEEGGTTCDRCGAEQSEAWVTSRLTGKLLQLGPTLSGRGEGGGREGGWLVVRAR